MGVPMIQDERLARLAEHVGVRRVARKGPAPIPLGRRLASRIDVDDQGCWLWMGKTAKGYGRITVGSWADGSVREVQVHRLVYEILAGPIDGDLTIDHLCRVRRCVNPDHLEPVPLRENLLRGVSSPAVNSRKTRCKRGHPFTPENTFITKVGYRQCRTCGRYHAAGYRRMREAA